MKIFRPTQLVLAMLLGLLSLVAFVSPSAQAQSGWTLDHYECKGAIDCDGVHTPWPATVLTTMVVIKEYGKPCQCVGSIQAVFVWHGSGQPPSILSALIHTEARLDSVWGVCPAPDDGFADPPVAVHEDWLVYSRGSHVVQVSNPSHSTTVKVPKDDTPCNMSAITNSDTVGALVTFQAGVGGGNVQAWSTHCAPALNGSDPLYDPANPQYFSGTGCQATGNAVALSGNVSHAQLCIGENGSDTVVKEYFAPTGPGAVGAASVPLNVMFDSTHFKDQAKIKVKLKVWDTNGGNYDVSVTAPAYNKGLALLNNTSESSADAFGLNRVRTALQLMHYAIPPDDGIPYGSFARYHRDDIYKALPTNSVFYMDTHASQDVFGDSYCGYEAGTYDNLCQADIENTFVTDSKGKNMFHVDITRSVLTKSNAQPPYNFVFIDGCETAGRTGSPISKTLSSAFGISGSARCFVGWHNEVFAQSTENINWKIRFWDNLRYGNSVWVAIEKATIDGDPLGEGTRGIATSETEVYPVMVGDWATKLYGVYHGKGTAWYIPL